MLYLVTHAEATHHVEQRVGGWYDSELTPRGQRHADRIAKELQSRCQGTPHLYTSDLTRARQTAAPIGKAFRVEPALVPELREASWGVAEGKASSWLDVRIVLPPRDGNRLDHRICEGAESRRDVATRVYGFMNRLLESMPETVILVTHGFALTFVVSAWLGAPIESLGIAGYRADSGSVSTLEIDPKWGDRKLVSFNETTHLSS